LQALRETTASFLAKEAEMEAEHAARLEAAEAERAALAMELQVKHNLYNLIYLWESIHLYRRPAWRT
jgi:hypothetical protein